MITRSTLVLLRFPFSFLLLPVYAIALLAAPVVDPARAWLVFAVLHFLLYPASNGFNSYYDRDEESIGMVRTPPRVMPDLLPVSLIMDALAILLALKIGLLFAAGCLIYGMASKAYSWTGIRIKKRPFFGWIFTGIGQGTLTFLLVWSAVQPGAAPVLPDARVVLPAWAVGIMLIVLHQPLSEPAALYKVLALAVGGLVVGSLLGILGTSILNSKFPG
jgi:1,4-dihydroxy-2-naphthoate octaprenyltransferase